MAEYLGYAIEPAFVILLLISIVAITLFLSSVFKKQAKPEFAKKIDLYSKFVGALTATLSLLVSVVGVATPLRPVSKDEAKSAIEQYFEFLQSKQFQNAYDIISEARKEERRAEMPGWGLQQYAGGYAGTRGYDNLNVNFVGTSGENRIYKVSYDVTDEAHHSILFGSRKELFSSSTATTILKRDDVANLIVNNLKQYYILPEESVANIHAYLDTRTLDSLADPLFISVMARDLRDMKINLIANPNHPSSDMVRRHFIHERLTLIKGAGGGWKIRAGLANPVIAVY